MEKYDATRLPTLIEQCNNYIAEFKKLKSPEEISAYRKDTLPPIKEVEDEISKLDEFIDYRQSLAEKAKEEDDDDKLEKLKKGKVVGLIHLRNCQKILNSLFKVYKDTEEKSEISGSKLLKLLQAPVAAPVEGLTSEEMEDFHDFVTESNKIEMAKLVEQMFELQEKHNIEISKLQKQLLKLQLGL